MAYFVKRRGDRIEIRESRMTARGPRSRQLARFTGALTPDVLAQAAARAECAFDARALERRAVEQGIAVRRRAPEAEVRALLARLRRGDALSPALAGLLVQALEAVETGPVPEELAEAAEWIGASPAERGTALRELLDAFGRIVESRPPRRIRPQKPFPRFSSVRTAAAS